MNALTKSGRCRGADPSREIVRQFLEGRLSLTATLRQVERLGRCADGQHGAMAAYRNAVLQHGQARDPDLGSDDAMASNPYIVRI